MKTGNLKDRYVKGLNTLLSDLESNNAVATDQQWEKLTSCIRQHFGEIDMLLTKTQFELLQKSNVVPSDAVLVKERAGSLTFKIPTLSMT